MAKNASVTESFEGVKLTLRNCISNIDLEYINSFKFILITGHRIILEALH